HPQPIAEHLMTATAPGSVALVWIEGGGVTTPAGFLAGGVHAGIKLYGAEPLLDISLLAAEGPCTVAGIFTRNAVIGEPVAWNRRVLAERRVVRALVCNSGNANTVTGEQGRRDCEQMAALAAERLGVAPGEVLVASTG